MEMKYKPTKPQKVKPAKPAKPAKAAKPAKIAPMGIGTAKAVKIEKPKAVKPPKAPKAPKPEKVEAISFGKPGKVEKAAKGGVRQPLSPKVVIAVLVVAILVVVGAVAAIILTGPASGSYESDIKKMTITELPGKTKYFVGERAMFDDMKISVTMKNGETYSLRPEDCKITGFDSTKAGTCKIKITYQTASCEFNISVIERPGETKILTGIKFEKLPKTQYKLGDYLDTAGGVLVREYKDGSTAKISLINEYVAGYEKVTGPGTYTLTVKYAENGLQATTTYTITVTK